MKKLVVVTGVLALSALNVGCSAVQGTVYKQKDGTYKATYSASTEKNVRKTIHSDAAITCKKATKKKQFVVVEETVENIEESTKKEGFAAVAGSAVNLAGKYFGSESVRGMLVFDCES